MYMKRSPLAFIIGLTYFGMSNSAVAGYQFESGDLSGTVSLGAGVSTVTTQNTNFGLGLNGRQSITWQELYLKPAVDAQYSVSSDTQLLGGMSVVSAATLGDGDAAGFTRGDTNNTALESLYAGVQYRDWTVKLGNMDYMIGSGFIVMDGNSDTGSDGAFFLAPRSAFQKSALISWQNEAISAQLFSLETDDDLKNIRFSGINMDYAFENGVQAGASAFKVTDVDGLTVNYLNAKGMQVYNARVMNAVIPALSQLTINAEYALQTGDGNGVKYDANAWYAEGNYSFNLPLSPVLSYRYSHFSGDENLDNTQNAWEPLTKGFITWGTWLIGDVAGNYLMNNSNENVHQVSARISLSPSVTIGSIYYHIDLDKANYQGMPVQNTSFGEEYALYADWTPTEQWYVSLSYNQLNPGKAAKEVFAHHDDPFSSVELYLLYHF